MDHCAAAAALRWRIHAAPADLPTPLAPSLWAASPCARSVFCARFCLRCPLEPLARQLVERALPHKWEQQMAAEQGEQAQAAATGLLGLSAAAAAEAGQRGAASKAEEEEQQRRAAEAQVQAEAEAERRRKAEADAAAAALLEEEERQAEKQVGRRWLGCAAPNPAHPTPLLLFQVAAGWRMPGTASSCDAVPADTLSAGQGEAAQRAG